MTIELNDRIINDVRRLGKQIDAGVAPYKEIRQFLTGIERKIEMSSASVPEKKNPKKLDRKDKYRLKLRISK